MKILLLNYTDTGGGAAIASYRLLTALRNNGIDATLGVVEKNTADANVVALPPKKHCALSRILAKLFTKFVNPVWKLIKRPFEFKTSNAVFHSANGRSKIDVSWINSSDYELVHLHWINSDMISIKDIARITKPIVWTMHDSWPFCGAEHHPSVLENDKRYKIGYTRESKPLSTKGFDLCRKVWIQKKKYLANKEITFISPSNWEKECLDESSLFGGKKCCVIPNILPSAFAPMDKESIRNLLHIPADKKIIGFGSSCDIDNPRGIKGSYYLVNALKLLKNPSDYFLVVFGNAGSVFLSQLPIPYFASGFISNERILSMLYNACDVFVCPSIIENLPFTCLESTFCGIPVTAFNVGGISDIVEHKVTGYLATPYDCKDLAQGISYCILNHNDLTKECIKKSLKFNTNDIVKRHLDVYNEVLNKF